MKLFVGIRLIIVGMVENEQGYEDFTDTSVPCHPCSNSRVIAQNEVTLEILKRSRSGLLRFLLNSV